jgi:hypothetical protein
MDFRDINQGAYSGLFRRSLCRQKAEISLCIFSEDECVVKEFLLSSQIIKIPPLTGFPLVDFSKVAVRPKITVLFFEFYVLLIYFISALNDVQNPHVLVLKNLFYVEFNWLS